MIDLEARWNSLCARHCTDASLITRRWNELKDAYSAPRRYYHNLNHLSFMLEQYDAQEAQIVQKEAFQMAIFIHDQVYNVKKNDNEEQSADLARTVMSHLGFPEESTELAVQHILATKSHDASENRDTNLLVDIDMAIVGQDWKRYSEYCQQIRKEYSIYPDILYKPGRRKVLQHFLEMDSIFKTPSYIDVYETVAQENIERELSTL